MPDEPGSTPRVVVGVDGSESGQHALRWAIRECELRGAELVVVHAWHVPYGGSYYPTAIGTFDPTLLDEAARLVLRDAVDREDTTGLAAEPTLIFTPNSPAAAVLEAAKTADLVVVGSRGLGGFKSLLLGSVGDQVANHAECPVVITREEG